METKIGREMVVRIPEHLRAQLDARAAEQDVTRSELVRRMLTWALAQPQAKA